MNLTLLICGGIVLIGIFIFLFLVFRVRKKAKGIAHYEAIRDKLTLREEEEKEEEEISDTIGDLDYIPCFSLSNFIMSIVTVGITIVIGMFVLSTLQEQLAAGSTAGNLTREAVNSLSETSINFIPIAGVFAVVALALTLFLSFTRRKEAYPYS